MSNTSQGSLTVVGTGIEVVSHLTTQAEHLIAHAEKVLYVVPGAWADEWMTGLNPNAESLSHLYGDDISRLETYRQMTETIMAHVRQGLRVCAVFYGHPAVFVTPSHEVIRLARAEGFEAKMCPGISAEDCLFADLGFRPRTRRLPELRGDRLPRSPPTLRSLERTRDMAGWPHWSSRPDCHQRKSRSQNAG